MGNTIFLKSKTFIKSIFGKKEFFNVIDYILVLMSIFCSGYFFFTSDNTTPRTIFTCITCVAILIRFFASFDINYLSKIKKDKKQLIPLPTTICFILIGVSAIFSLFLNKEESYFISYFYFGILVISAFLLCRSISFDKFKTIFCKLMFAFSIVSITLFVAYKIAGFPVGLVQIGNKGNVLLILFFLMFKIFIMTEFNRFSGSQAFLPRTFLLLLALNCYWIENYVLVIFWYSH